LRALQKAFGAIGEFFEVHGCISLLLHPEVVLLFRNTRGASENCRPRGHPCP
jgi:hypothetical protein